jgi:hypothetical protein
MDIFHHGLLALWSPVLSRSMDQQGTLRSLKRDNTLKEGIVTASTRCTNLLREMPRIPDRVKAVYIKSPQYIQHLGWANLPLSH